jgi:hypothetical protein
MINNNLRLCHPEEERRAIFSIIGVKAVIRITPLRYVILIGASLQTNPLLRCNSYGFFVAQKAPSELGLFCANKKSRLHCSQDLFVGVAGFEPATSWSQTRRDDRATLHPEK